VDWDGHSLAIRTKIKVLARRVHALVANSVNSLAAARGVAHSAVLDEVLARVTVDDVIELTNLDEAVIGVLLIGDSLARFANVEIGTFDTFETNTIYPTAAHIAPRAMSYTRRGRSWSRCQGGRVRKDCCIPHRTLVNDDATWFMECEELVVGIVGIIINFAGVAEVEVRAVEALVTDTDDRPLIATIAGNGTMDDWARLARTTVAIERIHREDGASHGNWLGDELERVIERSTVNCICGMIPRAFAAEVIVGAFVALVTNPTNMLSAAITPDIRVKRTLFGPVRKRRARGFGSRF
jgi:hypothetical protein